MNKFVEQLLFFVQQILGVNNSEAIELLKLRISEIDQWISDRERELDQARERQETLSRTIEFLEEENRDEEKKRLAAEASKHTFVQDHVLQSIRRPTRDASFSEYKAFIRSRPGKFSLSDIIVAMRAFGINANHTQVRRAITVLRSEIELVSRGSGRRPSYWKVLSPQPFTQKTGREKLDRDVSDELKPDSSGDLAAWKVCVGRGSRL